MPVVLGENLTLEENKLSAVYKELYTKLNKAYAWTNTQTTSSGGTAVVLYNGDVLTSIECNDINSLGIVKPTVVDGRFDNKYILINNYLYYYNSGQLINSNINNIKKVYSGYGSGSGYGGACFFINNDNKLYRCEYYNNTFNINEEQTNIIISDISEINTAYGSKILCIGNGNLYSINSTAYNSLDEFLIDNSESWNKVSGGFAITNGYLYHIYDNNLYLCDSNNNWVDIKLLTNDNYNIIALNSNNELYKFYINDSNQDVTKTYLYNNINKFYPTHEKIVGIINNNELFYFDGYQTLKNNDMIWSDTSYCYDNYFFAIGDNKLYKVEISSNDFIFTQIGDNSSYVKLNGLYNDLCVAWTGTSTSFSHTVYTTKKPIKNDKTYSNANNEIYSTISSVDNSLNTITDEYRTYERDISKDSHFTEIPPASIHETVSVIDILNATNPNN